MSYESTKIRSPCHQGENNQGEHQHDDGEPVWNRFVVAGENEAAQRGNPSNQDAGKRHLCSFLVLLDRAFANAR